MRLLVFLCDSTCEPLNNRPHLVVLGHHPFENLSQNRWLLAEEVEVCKQKMGITLKEESDYCTLLL